MRPFLSASVGIAIALIGFDAAQAATNAPQTALAASENVTVTPQQRARLAERLRVIEQIGRIVEADLRSTDNASSKRRWMLESLYAMPLEKLRSIRPTPSFQALSAAIVSTSDSRAVQQKALGEASNDLVYKPIAPCRFVDTRVVGGKLSGSRTFDISQSGNVYGGDANCNMPSLAGAADDAIAAIAMNVTYFDTSTAVVPGFIGVRPNGSTNLTSVLNWNISNAFAQDANTTVVTTNQLLGTTDDFEVFMSAGSVHVIIDIMGMFLSPQATALDCVTVGTNGAGTVPNATTFPFPTPTLCPAGYTGVAIACEYGPVPPSGLELTSVGAADVTTGFLTCLWRNDSGGTLNGTDFHTHTRCCRVPGR